MALKKKINDWRGRILRVFTNQIGLEGNIGKLPPGKPLQKILICRPNHRLGNQLLITPLLNEIEHTFPDAEVHLFLKGNLGAAVFKNFGQVKKIFELPKRPFSNIIKYLWSWSQIRIHQYDLAMNVISISGSGRIATRFSRATVKSFGFLGHPSRFPDDYIHLAKNPVYNFRDFLTAFNHNKAYSAITPLDLRLSAEELALGRRELAETVKNNSNTITLFTFATGAKCYSTDWWNEFYEKLQRTFPSFNIVEILPVEGVSSIGFRAITYSHKDIRRVAAVIAASTLWVGADSGVMHLATAAGALTAGLFSVTEPVNLAPYNGESQALDTRHLSIDACIEQLQQMVVKARP